MVGVGLLTRYCCCWRSWHRVTGDDCLESATMLFFLIFSAVLDSTEN